MNAEQSTKSFQTFQKKKAETMITLIVIPTFIIKKVHTSLMHEFVPKPKIRGDGRQTIHSATRSEIFSPLTIQEILFYFNLKFNFKFYMQYCVIY